MICYGDIVGQWVAEKTDGFYCSGHSVAIGLFNKGDKIVAGVIFEGNTGKSVVAHIAIERMNREFLYLISEYAFRQLGVNKVIAPVWSSNARMIDLAINMEFQMESVIEDAQPQGDGAIYFMTLTKDRCRFLQEKYKNGKTQAARGA